MTILPAAFYFGLQWVIVFAQHQTHDGRLIIPNICFGLCAIGSAFRKNWF